MFAHMQGDWHPDETLFSLASRHHRSSNRRLAEETCLELFGRRRQGLAHDFPAYIDHLVTVTAGRLGDAESIIQQRTLLPYFLHFRDQDTTRALIDQIRRGPVGPAKAKLGILSSSFGSAHPLKSCGRCIVSDIDHFDVAHWHRDHQWPGALVCPVHGEILQRGLGKTNTTGRFFWWLPQDMQFVPLLPTSADEDSWTHLEALTNNACRYGRMPPGFHPSMDLLERVYVNRLQHLELASGSGRLKPTDIGNHVLPLCIALGSVYGLSSLPRDPLAAATYFLQLLRKRPCISHPLRHLLFITSIFENWDAFLDALTDSESSMRPGRLDEFRAAKPVRDDAKLLLPNLVRDGASLSSAARLCGVSVATAKAWAGLSGLSPVLRPKLLTRERRREAISRLRKGVPKATVATAIGMSLETVTLLLRSEPGLHAEWRTRVFARLRQRNRRLWSSTAEREGYPSIKKLRALAPAAYAWLYRNDKDWLQDFSKRLTRTSGARSSRVNWALRDQNLESSIRRVATSLTEADPPLPVSLASLCNLVEALKPLLSKIHKLPRTKRALQDLLGSSEAGAQGG